MLGLLFETCQEFGLSFQVENCKLSNSSFYKLRLKQSLFKNNDFSETDFTEADLSETVFENCDFNGARFDHTNLEKADFTSAYNYSIDPEMNRVKKARFSSRGVAGLLDKYDLVVEG